LTGKLAVCAGSCGPGNLHLINGLFDAQRNGAPVLAIAAQIPSSEIGTGYFQETHPTELFRECSHYCELVSHPRQFPRVLQTAMQHAIARRGVSVVVLPGDVAGMDVPSDVFANGAFDAVPVVRPADAERLGRRSKLDLGLCGDVRDTIEALLPLVEAKADRSFLDAMCERHEHARRKLRRYVDHVGTRRPIHPEHVAATLDELASSDAV